MRPTRPRSALVALFVFAALAFAYVGAPLSLLSPEFPAKPMVCSGDHEVCGCDPVLVAAKACCCFKSAKLKAAASSCCAPHAAATEAHAAAESKPADGKLAGPWLSLPTCGGGSPYLAPLALRLDCTLVEAAALPRPGASGTVPTAFVAEWPSRAERPPVPPPKAV